ncbi:MAG: 50S ribosomal protein L22 [Verrucomicrobia bacterium]|nr:50S ribosomal protein L22 [Verrucomicrobiota bacterium]
MEVQAITRNVHMSPQKMREVCRQIQGLPALKAKAALQFVCRKSAREVEKTLKSAIANAENGAAKAKAETLIVREAVAQTGMRMKRFTPKARGSAGPIIKRYCHIKIVLTDEE